MSVGQIRQLNDAALQPELTEEGRALLLYPLLPYEKVEIAQGSTFVIYTGISLSLSELTTLPFIEIESPMNLILPLVSSSVVPSSHEISATVFARTQITIWAKMPILKIRFLKVMVSHLEFKP